MYFLFLSFKIYKNNKPEKKATMPTLAINIIETIIKGAITNFIIFFII